MLNIMLQIELGYAARRSEKQKKQTITKIIKISKFHVHISY